MNKVLLTGIAASALTLAGCATTMNGGMDNDVAYVDGAAMYANQNIIENAVNSPIHTTLVAAAKQAQLVDTLSGPGPFTVFAPTDAAFAKLPAGTVDTLLKRGMSDFDIARSVCADNEDPELLLEAVSTQRERRERSSAL